jgi:hypothetical protein
MNIAAGGALSFSASMPTQERELRELSRLADAGTLTTDDYERMATAVFGNELAQDEAKAKLWEQRSAKLITFNAYEYRREQIEDTTVVDRVWKRLQQDLYQRERPAIVGVQLALGHEMVHALRNATGQATRSRLADELETIGIDDVPEWIGTGRTVSENDLRTGWARLQEQVAELRTGY